MRRKSFDVLFETKTGMAELALHPALWRSLLYFVISAGAFIGVCTNVLFAQQPLSVRAAILVGLLTVKIVAMLIFGCFLHGFIDACGDTGGNVKGLLCIMGFAALPFLLLTPLALMSVTLGGLWLLLLPFLVFIGTVWGFYLIVRAVEAVYLIAFSHAFAVALFAVCLWVLLLFAPMILGVRLLLLSFF